MRFSSFSAVAALVVTVLAQDITQLPTCAANCLGNSLSSTGCSTIDVACICKSSSWISTLSCCVSQKCSAADQDQTLKYAQNICAPSGATLPKAAGCSNGTASATTSSSSTSSATSTTARTSGSSSAASTSGTAAAASSVAAAHHEQLGMGLGLAAAGLLAAVL